MASVLITGITGFVGKHLAAHLTERGYDVTGTSTRETGGVFQCNLADRNAVMSVVKRVSPDIVIHLAALSSVTSGTTMQYYETNVLGTEHVLQAVDALGGRRRFLLASTAGVYGNQNSEILDEDLTPKPVSHYGISKLACECLVQNYRTKHDVTILRPFNVIGVGQNGDFIVPKLVRHFAAREPLIRLGNLDPVRDYIDVETSCEIIGGIIDNTASYGEVLNVCAGSGTSVRDLLTIMRRLSGHDIEVVAAPEFMRANEVMRLLGGTKKMDAIYPSRPNPKNLEEVVGKILGAAMAERRRA